MLNINNNIDRVYSYFPQIKNFEERVDIANHEIDKSNIEKLIPYYQDKISISDEYYYRLDKAKADATDADNKIIDKSSVSKRKSAKDSSGESKNEDKVEIKELENRDQEVRTHEQAHKAAGGGLVKGTASYSYTIGPNGKQYAIGGEVKVDMAPVDGDPEATIKKMQQVKKAALAPLDPSSQDLSVASLAGKIETQARQELAKISSSSQSNFGIASQNSSKRKAQNIIIM